MKTSCLLDWLLEKNNSSVRYFTLKLLLDKADHDLEVQQAKADIMQSIPITEILKAQKEEGYWNHPKKYMSRYNGTYWNFMMLLELGVDPNHPSIQKAAKYLLEMAFNKEKKGFVNEIGTNLPPCYNGYLLWAMLVCKFYNTPEIRDCIDGIIVQWDLMMEILWLTTPMMVVLEDILVYAALFPYCGHFANSLKEKTLLPFKKSLLKARSSCSNTIYTKEAMT